MDGTVTRQKWQVRYTVESVRPKSFDTLEDALLFKAVIKPQGRFVDLKSIVETDLPG